MSAAHPTAHSLPVRCLILGAFLVSGAAGLVYEVVWARSLSLIFGVSVYAAATVLAVFMGGLALGAYVFGRRIDRGASPLLVYAALEAGIGLYALLVPSLLEGLRPLYVVLHRFDMDPSALAVVRACLAFLILLVPTTLMGGTFPVLTRELVRSGRDVGRGTGLLYFVNTAGAIAGCLLAGFLLIERFGMTQTTRIAAAFNLTVAAVAMALARGRTRSADLPQAASAASSDPWVGHSAGVAQLALVCVGLSGATALGYEVLWMRALLRYLYNSTYAFTTMLASFLAGIAIGSGLYAVLLRRYGRPLLVFAALEVLVGVGFAVSGILFADLKGVSSAFLGSGPAASFGGSIAIMFVRASLILMVPAVFLGATVPLAAELYARTLSTLGRAVGRVYAVNTFGAIVGSIGTAFVTIPALGMQGTLLLLIAVNLMAAAALAVAELSSLPARTAAAGTIAAVLAGVWIAVPARLFERTLGSGLVYYREGATDTVAVQENALGRMIVYDDLRGTAGTMSYRWNYFLGHLPLLLHPGTPRSVLHICFGVGNSLSAMAAHESLERIDSVELSPHVLEAAKYFWTNGDVLSDPRVRTIIEDGRNFVLTSRDTYDVIELEPPETFTAGVINLYTREFYQEAGARLTPDGVMLQWVPVGEAPLEAERMLFRAFLDVFPHASAWRLLEDGPLLLLGTRRPLSIDYHRLAERMREPRVRRDLELVEIQDVDQLLSFFIFDAPAFAAFARGLPPVTDDRTVLDFAMPRYIGTGFGAGSLNPAATDRATNALAIFNERTRYYFDRRRSVVPYLTGLGGEERREIEARIDAIARWLPFPSGVRVVRENAWRR